jgi:hypothetical protein
MTRRRAAYGAIDQPLTVAGIVYRTRVHARWGVALETLGLPARYRRGDERIHGTALVAPDFWLPSVRRWLQCETSAPKPDVFWVAQRVRTETGYAVFVLCGFPTERHQPGWPVYWPDGTPLGPGEDLWVCLTYALGLDADYVALDALKAACTHAAQTVRLSTWYRVGDILRTAWGDAPWPRED